MHFWSPFSAFLFYHKQYISHISYDYDDIYRYVYLLDEKTFASFGFSDNKKLVEVEMIFDKDMANDVFKSRKIVSEEFKL